MRIRDVMTVLREYGPRWLAYRIRYELELRHGFERRLPAGQDVSKLLANTMNLPVGDLDSQLDKMWKKQGGQWFFPQDVRQLAAHVSAPEIAVQEAEEIKRGRFKYFSRCWRDLGQPIQWVAGQEEKAPWPSDRHWSRIPDLAEQYGDIKHVWEPSRFGHVFTLARAYAVTGDDSYVETFWDHVETWLAANPPEIGPHYRCAQEMSLRSMAWIFGLYAFRQSPATTPKRTAQIIKQLWWHACHVDCLHWYAVECVKNNHSISEAAGLFSIGTVFPFLPNADRWKQRGLLSLERELGWQIYDDGAYVQHSTNYSRLVVQLVTWVLGLAKVNDVTLPASIPDRGRRLLQMLTSLQDSASGRLPNYGSNDGALIFPLTACDYLDYRPALGALSLALDGGRLYPEGPWDEEASWLVADRRWQASLTPVREANKAFPVGGYFHLSGESTHSMIRCATYRDRPAQADMLHLDVWYRGQNVLIDPGTCSYNMPAPWVKYFTGTSSHNTVTVGGKDQMLKGSRFMWLNWTKSRVLRFDESEGVVVFQGEHCSYSPIVHRRTVVLRDGVYLVVDDLAGGDSEQDFRLHWLVNDFPLVPDATGATITLPDSGEELRLEVQSAGGGAVNFARAEDVTPRGWHSLYYGERLPAWSLEFWTRGTSARFVTVLGPQAKVSELLPTLLSSLAELTAE